MGWWCYRQRQMGNEAGFRVIRHIHALWGQFWPLVTLPLVVLAGYVVLGEARIEHVLILPAITLLAVATRLTRDLILSVIPGIAILVGYEAVRVLRPFFVTTDRVFGCEFQRLDAALFGFGSGQTPADLFTRYNSTAADLFFALPYTLFWGVVVLWCGVLFMISRGRLRRYLWVLALVHLVAFVIWMAVPAAPPWYVRSYGCGIDIAAPPEAAALSRLDTLFGIGYFEAFYSRAPSVFGAFPSLHVSFPAVAMVTGWRWFGATGRAVTVALTVWMIAASVYLDHHWLVDGLATLALVGMIHVLLNWVWPNYSRRDPRAVWHEVPR
jgi:inositol phosphorylceramide synthase catalytic subunit